MTIYSVTLPDEIAERLRGIAEELGISPEDAICQAVEDFVDAQDLLAELECELDADEPRPNLCVIGDDDDSDDDEDDQDDQDSEVRKTLQ